jgi:endonuclease I
MINRIAPLLLLFSISYSQDIIGEGLSGQPLLDYVVNNYKTSTTLGYTDARDIMYGTIDLQDGNQLSCVYTGFTITLDTTADPSTNAYEQGINCEHTYPQSMGAGDEPQKSDMHHLFPCKSNVNSSRGNDPFADVDDNNTSTWYRNDYSQTEIPTDYIDEFAEKYNPDNASDETFEPREDHKGDASRAMFYFFAMYNDVADTNFWNEQRDVLLDWHYYDEVDDWELNRTWAIASYQENQPNPFVLDSSLARRIWYMDDGGTDTSSTDTTVYNIIINEIMQNPSAVSDANGEWFEIYNNSDEEIDMDGFTIKDNDTDSHLITEETLIAPYSFAVLGRNADTTTNGGVVLDYEYSGFTLANGADEILLIDPSGNTVDSVVYDDGSTFPDPNGATMALFELNLDNTIGGNWVEYDSLTYGNGDYGTPGESNFAVDIEWDFSLSEPIITVFGDDDEWNPEDTISIKMELCNNSDYDHGYYPGAMLEADSNLVTIMNENWFYGMMANTCDSVVWNVIANNIEVSTQVEFIAYPTILNCEDNPEFCIEGDTISFSIPINVEQSFDCTAGDGTEGVELWHECYSIEHTTILQLWNSGLTDSIPSEIGSLTNLTELYLQNNQLTGSIPSEIGNLTNLTYLWLSNNQLTDSIPPEIGNLINLTWLDLTLNELTGSILPEIGNLVNLTWLYLSTNQLTGSIPPEIGSLTNLTSLRLNDNQLTGEIPESICDLNLNWSNGGRFNITNNQLCPPYPSCIEEYVGEQDTTNCGQVSIIDETLPITYNLHNAYPNPFNPVTTLRYDIPKYAFVNITIYDMMGRVVKTLVNGSQTAGYRTTQWDATNNIGQPVSAGLYLYTIQAGEFRQTKKMVLLK